MAHKDLVLALSVIAASPLLAANTGPAPTMPAPAGTPETRYCMRVEVTGNIVDPVECWTRDEWAEQGVDVDKEWAKEGVSTIG
jgi:hypothetical protein